MIRSIVVACCLLVYQSVSGYELAYSAPENQGLSSEGMATITEWSAKYVDEGKLAGMVTLVARRGDILHFEAVGQRGSGDPRSLTRDALFRIYSMTKPVTSVAIMMLIEDGKLRLDDPVAKYLPELASLTVLIQGQRIPPAHPITVRHLLTHTAGFSYGWNRRDPVDVLYAKVNPERATNSRDFLERLSTLPLKFEPGDQWHYGVAVDVLGVLVERISGKPFDRFLSERLFEPLGMVDTFFNVPEDKLARFLPNHVWDWRNRKLFMLNDSNNVEFKRVKFFSGGGGLVSTMSDYFRFTEMLRRGGSLDGTRVLKAETVALMTRDHLPDILPTVEDGTNRRAILQRGRGFGLGFDVVLDTANRRGAASIGDYSWSGIAGTFFWIDPVLDIVAIGMIQVLRSPLRLSFEMKNLVHASLMTDED
ncbi:MAG: serine hydrolase domain-containing protein [Pseudomonadota bacterium]|nr:serine hydrolase domain-containing protein [Pseudomonadota bacterium]